MRGKKALVIDPALAGSLTVLVQTSTLKARGTGSSVGLLCRVDARPVPSLISMYLPLTRASPRPPYVRCFRSTVWTSCFT